MDNTDTHSSDAVKMAVKRRQMKDFQFQNFCNLTLKNLRNHWMFVENGIVFAPDYNLIAIERQLNCTIQLGENHTVSTHDNNKRYDIN